MCILTLSGQLFCDEYLSEFKSQAVSCPHEILVDAQVFSGSASPRVGQRPGNGAMNRWKLHGFSQYNRKDNTDTEKTQSYFLMRIMKLNYYVLSFLFFDLIIISSQFSVCFAL